MKTVRLAAWLLGIAAVVILSVSLGDLKLRAGSVAVLNPRAEMPLLGTSSGEGPDLTVVIRILSLVSLVVVIVALVLNLLTREGRRRVLACSAAALVILLVAEALSLLPPPQPAGQREPPPDTDVVTRGPVPATVPVLPRLAPPPAWLVASVAGVGVLLAAGGTWAVVAAVRRRRQPSVNAQLAEHTRAAADALARGGNLRDIIQRCYRDMLEVVEVGLGLHRGASATPGEFAALLERAGLPPVPVRQLTAVFEEVRYGRADPTPQAEERARESLSAIARFCEARV